MAGKSLAVLMLSAVPVTAVSKPIVQLYGAHQSTRAAIVSENLATLISTTAIGEFVSNPSGANIQSRTEEVNGIRLYTSEINITVDADALSATITAKTGSNFYSGSATVTFTMPATYTLPNVFGTIADPVFTYNAGPIDVLDFLVTNAAGTDAAYADASQLLIVLTGSAGSYTATVTPASWSTLFTGTFSWNYTVVAEQVDISTIVPNPTNIGNFIGNPDSVAVAKRIKDLYPSIASLDFLDITNVTSTGATVAGQGYYKGSTVVTFTVVAAPPIDDLVADGSDITPATNNWYNEPSHEAILSSVANLNPISQTSYPGLQWYLDELDVTSVTTSDNIDYVATITVKTGSTHYEVASTVDVTFSITARIDIDTILTDDGLLSFETDPSGLTPVQQFASLIIAIEKWDVILSGETASWEAFRDHEFNSNFTTLTFSPASTSSSAYVEIDVSGGYEFTGDITLYYAVY